MTNKTYFVLSAVLVAASVNAQETSPLQPEVAHRGRSNNSAVKASNNRRNPVVDGPEKFAVQEAAANASPGSDSIIPAVLDGDTVRTRIQFTNVDSSYSSLSLTFADSGGYATRLDVTDVGYVSAIKVSLPGKSSYEVVTSGSGDFTAGWAVFSYTGGRVVAQRTIEELDGNGIWHASTTPAASIFANRFTMHFDHRRGWDTQVILVNCNPYTTQTLTMTVRNGNGQIVRTESFKMSSLNSGAINSLRDAIVSDWSFGTVEFSVLNGAKGGIAAAILRYNESGAFELVNPQTVSGWVD